MPLLKCEEDMAGMEACRQYCYAQWKETWEEILWREGVPSSVEWEAGICHFSQDRQTVDYFDSNSKAGSVGGPLKHSWLNGVILQTDVSLNLNDRAVLNTLGSK